MFELKITANDANELANQVGMLAVALSAAFTPRTAAPAADPMSVVAEVFAAEVAATKKTRAKKGQTIDHDPNEGGKDAVHGGGTGSNGGVGGGVLSDEHPTADAPAADAVVADLPAGEPVGVAAPAAMTFDELKAYGIAYLNDTIPKADDRKAEYRAILDHFKVEKFGDLKPEQYAPFQVEVDRRRAAAAAKKAG